MAEASGLGRQRGLVGFRMMIADWAPAYTLFQLGHVCRTRACMQRSSQQDRGCRIGLRAQIIWVKHNILP